MVLITVEGDGHCWWGASCVAGVGQAVPSNDPALKATPIVAEFLIKQTRAGR